MPLLPFDKPLKNGLRHGRDAAVIPTFNSTLRSVRMSQFDDLL